MQLNYVYEYNIATMCLVLVLAVLYCLRLNYNNFTHKLFLILMFCVFTCACTDTLSVFTLAYAEYVPLWCNYLIIILYLLSFNFTGIFFFSYVSAKANPKNKIFGKILRYVVSAINLLLIVPTPITKAVFYFDENLNYLHGNLFPLLYVTSFFVLAVAFIELWRNKSKIGALKVFYVSFFMLVEIGATVMQMFYSKLLLTDFVMVLFLTVVYFTIQNSDVYIVGETNTFNTFAFTETVKKLILKKKKFNVIAFKIDEYSYYKKIYPEKTSQFILNLTTFLKKTYGSMNVYETNDKSFIVISSDIDKVILNVRKFCKEYTKLYDENFMSITPNFCVIKYPDFVDSAESILAVIKDVFSQITFSLSERVHFADKSIMDKRTRKSKVERAIRKALRNNSLQAYFQPIYNLKTEKFNSLETLLRINDDELGFIPADEIVSVAEETDLILSIDHQMFHKVCEFIRDNDLKSLGVDYLEFNLSGKEFSRNNLTEVILDHMEEYGVSPRFFNFEITETARMFRGENQIEMMNKLIEKGSSFSMDDYGTGYSSMEYLLELPVNLVKIDKSLLWSAFKEYNGNEQGYSMFIHMAKLLKEIGKKIVVEGVETEEMVKLCEELNCNYLQGYYFSKPIPPENVMAFLKDNNLEKIK